MAEYSAASPQKKIEIYVGTREIVKLQLRKFYSFPKSKREAIKTVYYFTGLGRLYTDYLWLGKLAFFFLIFLCSLKNDVAFIVENLPDKTLLKKLTCKTVYRVNGSGFFENINDNFLDCHVSGRSPKPQKIAYISRFGKSKHTDKVMLLAKSLPIQKELLIAGFDISGQYFSRQFTEIARRRPNVKFYGEVRDRSKLFCILKKCDLLIYPSKREGCPFTVFEALTTNTLPIVSCTPGCEDLAHDIGIPSIPPDQFKNFEAIEKAYVSFFSSQETTDVKVPKALSYSFNEVKNQFLLIFKDI